MSSFFAILFLLSLLGLIIGLVRPDIFKPILKQNASRKIVTLGFVGLSLLFLILTGVTAPNTKPATNSSTRLTHATYQPLDAWYTDPAWVGYVEIGKNYQGISASWTVPEVSASAADNTPAEDELSSTWIGIGGFNNQQLIQIGTNQSIVSVGGGGPAYFPFYERFPTDPNTVQITELTTSPGDNITASIQKQTGDNWLVELTDSTTGQSFSKTVSFSADQTSAEWIMENESHDLGGTGIVPKFGSVSFSNLTLDGKKPAGLKKIKMIRNNKTVLEPSSIGSDGSSFSISE